MREYRGRCKDNGEWVEGWYLEVGGQCFIVEEPTPMTMGLNGTYLAAEDMIEVLPETVGEYAGLLDKNKKKGYDGDLISSLDRHIGKLIKICWGDGCWCGRYVDYDFLFPLNTKEMSRATIVGSIHDNPKLLEATK